MTTAEASTEGKFYIQGGTLRYRSSRTPGTAFIHLVYIAQFRSRITVFVEWAIEDLD